MSETRWGYAVSDSEESWRGSCATREEAIAEAREELGLEPTEPFWICQGRQPDPHEFVPSADWILEVMGERAGDEAGEIADEWPDCDEADKKALEDLLHAWADKHCAIHFWVADGKPEEITIT